jgi:hypothetical protein
MKSSQSVDNKILRVHYSTLMRRLASWAGIAALVVSVVMPITANATGELTSRSDQLSTSSPAVGATTSYTFSFKPATTATIEAIGFQVCGSPIEAVTCAAVSSSSMAASTFSTAGQSAPFNASWTLGGAGNCGAHTATYTCINYVTGTSLTSGTTYTVTIGGIQNPEAANTQFYTRITTYTVQGTGSPSGETDFGAQAVSTGTTVNVSALVQESLIFSVGTSDSGTCGTLSGNQVYLGSPVNGTSSSVLSSSAASAGTSIACVATNGGGGYVLSYTPSSVHNNTFTNYTGVTHDFGTNSTGATVTSGTSGGVDFFGLSMKAATPATGDIAGGANVTGASGFVTPTSYGSGYGTADSFAFNNAANTILASETTGATVATKYTMLYEAQAGTTTPYGQYEVNMDFVATSTY